MRRESSRQVDRPRSEESDQRQSKRIKVDQSENVLAMIPASNEDEDEDEEEGKEKGGANQPDPSNTLDTPGAKIDIAIET